MAKHIYLAHAADGTEFKRTSASRGEGAAYTHTVVYKGNFNRDLDRADKISALDADNFAYYSKVLALGHSPHGNRNVGQYPYLTAEYVAAQDAKAIAEAKAAIGDAKTGTEYQFAKRDERVARVLAARDNGAYDVWHNAGWCGRLDLAQKLAQATTKYGNLEITILEAVKVK